MRLRPRVGVAVTVAALLAACIDFTGLPEDRSRLTKGTGAGGDSVAVDASTPCSPLGATTCAAPSCDDGVSGAAGLVDGALECAYRSSGNTQGAAATYCAGLGAGFRLATKGEALRIAATPSICRASPPAGWLTWTGTCVESGIAWSVASDGQAAQRDAADSTVGEDVAIGALCLR